MRDNHMSDHLLLLQRPDPRRGRRVRGVGTGLLFQMKTKSCDS